MAEHGNLTDYQLVQELRKYGENIDLPVKYNKRKILLKKLNHLRARNNAQQASTSSGRRSTSSKSAIHEDKQIQTSSIGSYTNTKPVYNNLNNRVRGTELEASNSDDSDSGPSPSFNYPTSSKAPHGRSQIFNRPSPRDFADQNWPQSSNSVSRPVRHRTAVFPQSEAREIRSQENASFISDDGEDGLTAPSSAKSGLYPDLSKYISAFKHSSPGGSNDAFEFSDSDADVPHSRYNTLRRTEDVSPSSSYKSSSSTHQPQAYSSRRNRVNGHSQYLEYLTLPRILFGGAVLIFFVLSITYSIILKDLYFSSSSSTGSGDQLLICRDDMEKQPCYKKLVVDKALQFLDKLFESLSSRKGQVLCGNAKSGEDIIRVGDWKTQMYRNSSVDANIELLFECCLDHILANPHWGIRALKEDGTLATNRDEVIKLESDVPSMSLLCRLRRSFYTVIYVICTTITVIAAFLLLVLYIKFRLKQKEIEQREVYAMVEKIIRILRNHHDQTKGNESDESPYLAVQHVRDQLLPPSTRRQLQPIWDKAVAFIATNESRIRLETRLIRDDEFEVWHWIQPDVRNDKTRLRRASDDDSDSERYSQVNSSTTRLKICNIFSPNVENDDGWEDDVVDAILDRCKDIRGIGHINVDSREGCVYMNCSSREAAEQARHALRGWRLNGQMVTVSYGN